MGMAEAVLFAISASQNAVGHLPLREHSYVCATFDFWPETKCDYGNCSWAEAGAMVVDFDNSILNQASDLLGPNFVYRFGGTLADHVRFDGTDKSDTWGKCTCDDPTNPTAEACYFKEVGKEPPGGNFAGFGNGCLSGTRLNKIMEFADRSQKKLIFDFSSEYGRTRKNYLEWEGDWSDENAREMIDFIIENDYAHLFYGFELGNEVWGLKTGDAHFPPEQAAIDYAALKELLDDKFGPGSKKLLALSGNWEIVFMARFAELFNDFDAVAWHWYPLGPGRGDDVIPNINDPTFRETELSPRLDQLEYFKRAYRKDLWMGETGGAFNSGQNTTTNTFMSHRWYLDQMGYFARRGHVGYCRQTMIGGNYGLLQVNGDEINVNPDFYGAHLFHRVMGDSILDNNVTLLDEESDFDKDNIHQYVHVKGSTGSVTVLIVNFSREQDVTWSEYNGEQFKNIESWIATAEDDQGILDQRQTCHCRGWHCTKCFQ